MSRGTPGTAGLRFWDLGRDHPERPTLPVQFAGRLDSPGPTAGRLPGNGLSGDDVAGYRRFGHGLRVELGCGERLFAAGRVDPLGGRRDSRDADRGMHIQRGHNGDRFGREHGYDVPLTDRRGKAGDSPLISKRFNGVESQALNNALAPCDSAALGASERFQDTCRLQGSNLRSHLHVIEMRSAMPEAKTQRIRALRRELGLRSFVRETPSFTQKRLVVVKGLLLSRC